MLANVNLAADLELVAAGGRIVVVGCRGSIEISPRLLMPKESTIVGCALMNATAVNIVDVVSVYIYILG